MGKGVIIVVYVLAMMAIVIAVDLLFFRHQFSERLIANITIVSVFVVFYLILLRHK